MDGWMVVVVVVLGAVLGVGEEARERMGWCRSRHLLPGSSQ